MGYQYQGGKRAATSPLDRLERLEYQNQALRTALIQLQDQVEELSNRVTSAEYVNGVPLPEGERSEIAQQHVNELIHAGYTVADIAEQAGVASETIRRVMLSKSPRIKVRTFRHIMAIPAPQQSQTASTDQAQAGDAA